MCIGMVQTVLCFAGQLSRKVREWHLSLSLYKLKAFVTCSTTELSTLEPLPFFHWTTDLQSTAYYIMCIMLACLLAIQLNALNWRQPQPRPQEWYRGAIGQYVAAC